MKKSIIIGICVTSLILLVAPTIPAQHYKEAEESIQISIQERIDSLLNTLQKKDINSNELEAIKSNFYGIFESLKVAIESSEFNSKPTFIKFLLNTIISLIFALFGTIFGVIFGPLLSLLVQLLTAPAVLLAKLISLIFGTSSNDLA
jgi:hypothetical protein